MVIKGGSRWFHTRVLASLVPCVQMLCASEDQGDAQDGAASTASTAATAAAAAAVASASAATAALAHTVQEHIPHSV